MRILIIDDSTYIRNTIRTTLESHEFEVIGEAGSGEVAMDMISEFNPDVITLDNILPDMTGIDILKACKLQNLKPYVIMISAVGQESAAQEALRLGAKHYLVKPLDHTVLVNILKNLSH